jgi:hypothetical protein
MGPSLGRMTAAYIDDVDWGLTGLDENSVFSQNNDGRALGDRARFDVASLQRFLGTLGHDDGAYSTVTTAQQAYSTSMLNAHLPTLVADGRVKSTPSEGIVRVGSQLQGIMDRAWVDEYKAKGDELDARFNASVDKRAERQQMIAGLITSGFFAFMPEPEEGIGATVVPLATDTVHDQIDGQIEQNIGAYADSQHRSLADVRQGKASDVYNAGQRASWIPADQLVNGNRLEGWDRDQLGSLDESLKQAQELGYDTGSLAQEQAGNLAVP